MADSTARDLRLVAGTLETFHLDMVAIEHAAKEHDSADVRRFKSIEDGLGRLFARLDALDNRLTVMQDSIVEGFRRERAGVNGGK